MGITVRHDAGLAPIYAPLAANAGIGELLKEYHKFIQPERIQQQQFAHQRQTQATNLGAQGFFNQQRAALNAATQRQQTLQALQSSLVRGQQAQQFNAYNRVLGSQLDYGRQFALNQQRGQQQFGLADFETRQRLEAMRLQDELLRGRTEAADERNLYQYGIKQQDQEISRFRQSPAFQQGGADFVRQFEGLTQRRNGLATNRGIMPEERRKLMHQNWQEFDKLISGAARQPTPQEAWSRDVLWQPHPDSGTKQPWVRNHNGEWQVARGWKDSTGSGDLDPIKMQTAARQVQTDRTNYVTKMMGLLKTKDSKTGLEGYPNGMGPLDVMRMLEQDSIQKYPMPEFQTPMPGNAPQPTMQQLGAPGGGAAPQFNAAAGGQPTSLAERFASIGNAPQPTREQLGAPTPEQAQQAQHTAGVAAHQAARALGPNGTDDEADYVAATDNYVRAVDKALGLQLPPLGPEYLKSNWRRLYQKKPMAEAGHKALRELKLYLGGKGPVRFADDGVEYATVRRHFVVASLGYDPIVKDASDFNALPAGSRFIDPTGKVRIKVEK
jgi:hypothetical protein